MTGARLPRARRSEGPRSPQRRPTTPRCCAPVGGQTQLSPPLRVFTNGFGPAPARHLREAAGPRAALVLRRGLVREEDLLREVARRRPCPKDWPFGRGSAGDRPGAGRQGGSQAGRLKAARTALQEKTHHFPTNATEPEVFGEVSACTSVQDLRGVSGSPVVVRACGFPSSSPRLGRATNVDTGKREPGDAPAAPKGLGRRVSAAGAGRGAARRALPGRRRRRALWR